MKRTYFIVLDGIDGSGKGEMVNRLHNYLFGKSKKFSLLTTREPTSGKYGEEVRKILGSDKDPMANAEKCLELFVKDREEHLEKVILPFMHADNGADCNIVICDRYYYSTIAFQHTQGLDMDYLINENSEFIEPDIVFILDLPVEIAIQRIEGRGESREKFEDKAFMEKLRENFLRLKKELDQNIIVIDASLSKEDVFEQIKSEIDKLIKC